MPGAVEQLQSPIYPVHVTIHFHDGSLLFKICLKLDKHMLDGC